MLAAKIRVKANQFGHAKIKSTQTLEPNAAIQLLPHHKHHRHHHHHQHRRQVEQVLICACATLIGAASSVCMQTSCNLQLSVCNCPRPQTHFSRSLPVRFSLCLSLSFCRRLDGGRSSPMSIGLDQVQSKSSRINSNESISNCSPNGTGRANVNNNSISTDSKSFFPAAIMPSVCVKTLIRMPVFRQLITLATLMCWSNCPNRCNCPGPGQEWESARRTRLCQDSKQGADANAIALVMI